MQAAPSRVAQSLGVLHSADACESYLVSEGEELSAIKPILGPLWESGKMAASVTSSSQVSSWDDSDLERSFEHELATFPMIGSREFCGAKLSSSGEAARDAALHLDIVVDNIFSFLHVSFSTTLAEVCVVWSEIVERRARTSARTLLATLLGGRVALSVEQAIFLHCGGAAGVGAPNDLLRRVFSNLSSNAELRSRVISGALAPSDLLRLPPEELATAASRAFAKRAREEAVRESRLASRLAADYSGRYKCARCGCEEQARHVYLRAGLTDVNRSTERLVCVECREEVSRHCEISRPVVAPWVQEIIHDAAQA